MDCSVKEIQQVKGKVCGLAVRVVDFRSLTSEGLNPARVVGLVHVWNLSNSVMKH